MGQTPYLKEYLPKTIGMFQDLDQDHSAFRLVGKVILTEVIALVNKINQSLKYPSAAELKQQIEQNVAKYHNSQTDYFDQINKYISSNIKTETSKAGVLNHVPAVLNTKRLHNDNPLQAMRASAIWLFINISLIDFNQNNSIDTTEAEYVRCSEQIENKMMSDLCSIWTHYSELLVMRETLYLHIFFWIWISNWFDK